MPAMNGEALHSEILGAMCNSIAPSSSGKKSSYYEIIALNKETFVFEDSDFAIANEIAKAMQEISDDNSFESTLEKHIPALDQDERELIASVYTMDKKTNPFTTYDHESKGLTAVLMRYRATKAELEEEKVADGEGDGIYDEKFKFQPQPQPQLQSQPSVASRIGRVLRTVGRVLGVAAGIASMVFGGLMIFAGFTLSIPSAGVSLSGVPVGAGMLAGGAALAGISGPLPFLMNRGGKEAVADNATRVEA